MMNPMLRSLAGGLTGAVALTAVHETVRRFVPEAPRADVLGMRALAKGYRKAGTAPPADEELHREALVGDLVSNALYYSLAGLGGKNQSVLTGAVLGTLAGAGALALPGPMGLGTAPTNRTAATQAMTVAWYLIGGLVAGAAYRVLSQKS